MLTSEQYKRLAERFVKQIRPSVSPSIPLYEPSPRSEDNQVRIGDVGIIVQGAFYRKFNVVDKKHPVNIYDEDLGEYQPIPFDPETDVDTKIIAPAGGTLWCSKGLSWKKVDADTGYIRYEFHKDSKDPMFAVLSPEIVQMTVKEEKLERWKAYMESNMKNWVEYAEQKTIINGAKFKPDDFVFVRGCTKTNQWVRATFEGAGDFTLEIDTSDWYYGSTLKQGGKDISDDWLVGETSESSIHCLALQGLRYEREGFWAPKKIVAGAEPRDSPRDDSDRRLDELIRAGTSRAACIERPSRRYLCTSDGERHDYPYSEFRPIFEVVVNVPSYPSRSSSSQVMLTVPISPTQLPRTSDLPRSYHTKPPTIRIH